MGSFDWLAGLEASEKRAPRQPPLPYRKDIKPAPQPSRKPGKPAPPPLSKRAVSSRDSISLDAGESWPSR
jgi:hypothetical protein